MGKGLPKKRNKPTNKERRQVAEAIGAQTMQRQDAILGYVKQMREAQQGMAKAITEMAKHNAIMMGVAKLLNDKEIVTNDELAQILIKAGIEYTVREQGESEEQSSDGVDSGGVEGQPELPIGPEPGTDSRSREESESSGGGQPGSSIPEGDGSRGGGGSDGSGDREEDGEFSQPGEGCDNPSDDS